MNEPTAQAGATRSADVGFHAGELAVQQRAGVLQEAARLAPMLNPVKLGGGIVAFAVGRTLHLSGTAEVEWDAPGKPGDDGRTGRRAVFTLQRLVAGRLLSSRQVGGSRPYPLSPPLTDEEDRHR